MLVTGTACAGDRADPVASIDATTTTTLSAAPTPAAPGRYTYAVQGRFSSNLLPAQPLVPTATLVVEPLNGSDQRQVLTFGEVVVDTVVRYLQEGVYTVSMKANEAGAARSTGPPNRS